LLFVADNSLIFDEILSPFEDYQKNIKYVGQFYANTEINEEGIWLLECVPRLGIPAIHAYNEILQSKWSDLFYDLATSKFEEMLLEKGKSVILLNWNWK
jgi:hypothetical protein